MNIINEANACIDTITLDALKSKGVDMDVLRLDKLHTYISGNKWFKLKHYLQQAQQQNKNVIVTFGGAFSNHIQATAATCKQYGLKAIGIIRGEKPTVL